MRIAFLRFLCVSLLCFSSAYGEGEGMGVDDLIRLKQAGFTEAEIQAEIEKSSVALVMTDANAARLKAAGFSSAFLAQLRKSGGGLTLDSIRAMHKSGKSANDILRALARSNNRPTLTTKQALDLTRAGVPTIVVRALRGDAVDADEVRRLVKGGAPMDELSGLIDVVGVKGKPTAAEALAMMRAGVSDKIVKRMRSGPGGSVSRAADGLALYEHPAGRFALRYPNGWRHMLSIQEEDVLLEFVFTPDQTESDPEKLTIGFSILPVHTTPGTTVAIASLDELIRLTLPTVLAEEPRLEVYGETKRGQLAGTEARFLELRGRMKNRGDAPLRLSVAVLRKDGVICFVSAWAPIDKYQDYSDRFGKCAESLQFGKPAPFSNRKRISSQKFIDRYRGSVVQVRSKKGTGTGFVVRKDGYVLTNHHVVFDDDTGKLMSEFTLHFEASLKRNPLHAVLVGSKRGRSKQTLLNLGGREVDIALLKIVEPGDYEALPISPLLNVKLSDPVVTMGFPYSGVLGGTERLSMFVTRGVVVRFNKDLVGQTEGLFIDAKITHGNSGGPCIDLETGGVIGLNTWGFDLGSGALAVEVTNNLVGYYGVVPIDAALAEWPDVLLFSADRAARLSTEDRVILAVDYFGQGLFSAAERQAQKVVAAEPDAADARVLLAASALQQGKIKVFSRQIDAALARDPNHYAALIYKAQLHVELEEFAKAALLADRAIKSKPDSPMPYLARGALYMAVKRYEDAVADAAKAAKLSHSLSSDPEILAGKALYELGKLSEGHQRFQKALKITPGRFDARMGVAEYYERQKKYEAAVLEYGKIAASVPLSPLPHEAMARCYIEIKQLAKARDAYLDAVVIYRKHALLPPEELFAQVVRVSGALGKNKQMHEAMVGRIAAYPTSIGAHVELALHYHAIGKAPALAAGHAVAAFKLAEGAADVQRAVAKIPSRAIAIDDIRLMEQLNYGTAGIVIVNFAPIAFRISTEFMKIIGPMSPFVLEAIKVIAARQDRGDKSVGVGTVAKSGTPSARAKGGRAEGAPPAGGSPAGTTGALRWRSPDGTMSFELPAGFKQFGGLDKLPEKDQFIKFSASDGKGLQIMGWAFAPAVTLDKAIETFVRFASDRKIEVVVKGKSDIKNGAQKLVHGVYTTPDKIAFTWIAIFGGSRGGGRGLYMVSPTAKLDGYLKTRNAIIDSFKTGDGVNAQAGGRGVPPPAGNPERPPEATPQRTPERTPEATPVRTSPQVPEGGPRRNEVPAPPGGNSQQPGETPLPDDGIPAPGGNRNTPFAGNRAPANNAGAAWTSTDRSFSFPIPAGYARNAQREKLVRQNNFGWIAMIAENAKLQCDLSAFVFPKNVKRFEDAEGLVGRFMVANNIELAVEKRVAIKIASLDAIHAWGTGGNQQLKFAWETIVVRTEQGMRGFWMQAYGARRDKFKAPRDVVVAGMKLGGVGGGNVGEGVARNADTTTWQDPQGRMSISYPRSYQVNQQAIQKFARNGVDFLPLLASDPKAHTDLLVSVFSPKVRTVDQAIDALARFEESVNAKLKVADTREFKIGQLFGKIASGKLEFPNGSFMMWEGVFFPGPNGARGAVVFGAAATWNELVEHRKSIFNSLRVLK